MPSMIRKPAAERSVVLALLPLMLAVFVAFLVIGAAMPVLPLHVQATLGFGPAMVGSVPAVSSRLPWSPVSGPAVPLTGAAPNGQSRVLERLSAQGSFTCCRSDS